MNHEWDIVSIPKPAYTKKIIESEKQMVCLHNPPKSVRQSVSPGMLTLFNQRARETDGEEKRKYRYVSVTDQIGDALLVIMKCRYI